MNRYEKACNILNNVFHYDHFKEHQYDIIDKIMNQEDVIAVMHTGYGKSICFQIPPLLSNEVAIVISPLIALMVDQQQSMHALGIKSGCYN